MEWHERERRLATLFSEGAKVRPHQILEIAEHRANQSYQQTYRGQVLFTACFTDFYLETLDATFKTICPKIENVGQTLYGYFVSFHLDQFKSMRCAVSLGESGYPLQGYSLLRNVYEEAIFMAAILQRVTTFSELQGLVEGEDFDAAKIKKRRRNAQLKVLNRMSGDASGLTEKTRKEIQQWANLFDYEIHGSRLSKTEQFGWFKGEEAVPNLLPRRLGSSDSMMFNRYNELAWMLLRLLPMLQIDPFEFTPRWKQEWGALESWLSGAVNSLTDELGKPVGAAISELVNTKFPFNPESAFPRFT